jgi:hypothetical protein
VVDVCEDESVPSEMRCAVEACVQSALGPWKTANDTGCCATPTDMRKCGLGNTELLRGERKEESNLSIHHY